MQQASYRGMAPNAHPLHVSDDGLAGSAELLVGGTLIFMTTNLWSSWVAPVTTLER